MATEKAERVVRQGMLPAERRSPFPCKTRRHPKVVNLRFLETMTACGAVKREALNAPGLLKAGEAGDQLTFARMLKPLTVDINVALQNAKARTPRCRYARTRPVLQGRQKRSLLTGWEVYS